MQQRNRSPAHRPGDGLIGRPYDDPLKTGKAVESNVSDWRHFSVLIQVQNLSWIHPVVGVQRALQRPHHFQRLPMLGL